MTRRMPRLARTLLAAALCALAPTAGATPQAPSPGASQPQLVAPQRGGDYASVVQRVANMVNDSDAAEAASAAGLQLLNVLWEDTGRWEGSSVGPNISDVTIEVEAWRRGQEHRTHLMPVMRHANFTDKTADVRLDKIMLPVGNQTGRGGLQVISLAQLLRNPLPYMSVRDRGKIAGGTLIAPRDTHALVSAQHAFLPVPKSGKATFWPVIFNYQSSQNNPAVLTILVTRQGTSITVIDNARDTVTGDGSWGQRLYFNHNGQKAPLIAERLADVKASGVTSNGESAASLGQDANVLMLIQVPLVYRQPPRRAMAMEMDDAAAESGGAAPPAAAAPAKGAARERSDVDVAVLGHGPSEGPFVELDGQTVRRDARFPVRVTLQFYQATSNGVISRDNVAAMAAQIKKVYGKGDYVGSLVMPSGADRQRPTNWTGSGPAFDYSLRDFPGLLERWARTQPLPPAQIGIP